MDRVEIRIYAIRENAEIAYGLLEDAGIPAMLETDDAGGAYTNIFLSGGGFRLYVNSEDQERAEEVLSVLKPENTR